MKKMLTVAGTLLLGAVLASPVMASGHRGHRGGHHGGGHYRSSGHHRSSRGFNLGISSFPVPRFHLPSPRISSSLSLSFGRPAYRYDRYDRYDRYNRYDRYYDDAYYEPVYYSPRRVYVEPCEPIWVPAHYAWDDGYQIYIEGHWSR
jgi:hypothetical protein